MLKKVFVSCSLVVLIIVGFFLTAVNSHAVSPQADSNGCYEIDGQYICPDAYCSSDTDSTRCESGRCYCKLTALRGTEWENCEVAFGAKATATDKAITLSGGVWSHLAQPLGSNEITFRKVKGTANQYESDFIQQHKKIIDKEYTEGYYRIKMVITAEFDGAGHYAGISDQCFQITTGPGSGEPKVLRSFKLAGDKKISHCGATDNSVTKSDIEMVSGDKITYEPTRILNEVIFNQKGSDNVSINCKNTDLFKSIDRNKEKHLLLSSLVTPPGTVLKATFENKPNLFCGQEFNKNEDKQSRNEKIKKIKDWIENNCKGGDPHPNCKQCSDHIVKQLEKNPKLSYNDVLHQGMTNEQDDICAFIDDSIVFTDNKVWTKPNTQDEMDLNNSLPENIRLLCDSKGTNEKERLACKNFALECYKKNQMKEQKTSMCDQLSGDLESSQWIICPVSNTLSGFGDNGTLMLEKLFSANINIFNSKTFISAWAIFRNLANALLGCVLMIIIISQITNVGLSNYNIKRMFPKLIVAALTVNLSFFISQVVVDLSNILGVQICEFLKNIATGISGTASSISLSSLAFGVITLGGVAAILGGLAILLPCLIVLVVGLVATFLMIALKDAFIMILILLMPLAILANVVPHLEKYFKAWLSSLLNALLLFPTMSLLYGSGLILKQVFITIGVGSNSNTLQILGFVLPAATILLTPSLLLNMMKGVSSIGGALEKMSAKTSGLAYKQADRSDFNQALRHKQTKGVDKMLSSKIAEDVLNSKAINKISYGSGKEIIRQRNNRRFQQKQNFASVLNNDSQVARAFTDNHGKTTPSVSLLTPSQQEQYKRLQSMGGAKNAEFQSAAIQAFANNGETDAAYLHQLLTMPTSQTKSVDVIKLELQNYARAATKNGNVVTAALLNYKTNTLGTSSHGAVINETALKAEINKGLNKVRPADLNDSNFYASAAIPTDADPNPTDPIGIKVMRDKLGRSFTRFGGKQSDIDSHYLTTVGQDYDNLPHALRTALEPDIVNAAVKAESIKLTGKVNSTSTARDALINLGILK